MIAAKRSLRQEIIAVKKSLPPRNRWRPERRCGIMEKSMDARGGIGFAAVVGGYKKRRFSAGLSFIWRRGVSAPAVPGQAQRRAGGRRYDELPLF